MDTTISPFDITFDGRPVVKNGDQLLETLPEHALPVTYDTTAMNLIGRQYPRLDDWGHVQGSFSLTTVRDCASHFEAWKRLNEWATEWLNAGKGTLVFDINGTRHAYEAIITEAEPKVQGLRFIVTYNFTLGKPCAL